jgi:hypothetical protein
MIYATASLQGAPWDTLIKSCRDNLGRKSHDYLNGYAADLFDYIRNNTHIFTQDVQEEQFRSGVDVVTARIVSRKIGNSAQYWQQCSV